MWKRLDCLLTRPLLAALRAYKLLLSPLLGDACRFHPTCSEYAVEALRQRGVAAIPLIVWRILRCQPLCAGGYDPVPAGRSGGCSAHEE